MTAQFLLGIDVEDKNATVIQMAAGIGKDLFPIGEAQNMVDRIENTADHIESFGYTESHDILTLQLGLWHLPSGDGQHFRR